MAGFLSLNLASAEHKPKTLKNAYHLLGQKRYDLAASFFLLAGNWKDAVDVLVRYKQDLGLALMVARLAPVGQGGELLGVDCCARWSETEHVHLSTGNSGLPEGHPDLPARKKEPKLETAEALFASSDNESEDLSGDPAPDAAPRVTTQIPALVYHLCINELLPLARERGDPWLRSIAFWHAGKYRDSVETLREDIIDLSTSSGSATAAPVVSSSTGGVGSTTSSATAAAAGTSSKYRLRCGARDPRSLQYFQNFLLNKLWRDKRISLQDVVLSSRIDLKEQKRGRHAGGENMVHEESSSVLVRSVSDVVTSTARSSAGSFLRARQPILAYLTHPRDEENSEYDPRLSLATLRSLVWLYLGMGRSSEDFLKLEGTSLPPPAKLALWRSIAGERPLVDIAREHFFVERAPPYLRDPRLQDPTHPQFVWSSQFLRCWRLNAASVEHVCQELTSKINNNFREVGGPIVVPVSAFHWALHRASATLQAGIAMLLALYSLTPGLGLWAVDVVAEGALDVAEEDGGGGVGGSKSPGVGGGAGLQRVV